jgi:tetratricopeptide (TPR) repeat protein
MRNSGMLWLVLAVTSGIALGQSGGVVVPMSAAKPAAAPASPVDYSGEPIVLDKVEYVYTIAADGTGSLRRTVSARIQSEASVRQVGVVSIPFASGTQRVEIQYVRVRRADGTVTETPVDEAIEMPSPVTTAAPFYSDLKVMQIPVRNLRAGDTLEWQATIVRTKAEAPGQSWGDDTFVHDTVTLSEVLELRVPKGLYLNVWSPGSKPVETEDGGMRVMRWESSQKKPTVGKEAEAEKERKKKQILTADEELDQEQGKLPDVAWTTFKSWEEVGSWYGELEKDRVVPDAEIKAKVAELIAGKSSEEDKVRAVYAYVSVKIRYIGVAFGIGRYRPHPASVVLENQYGDCKDKHTLLASMLVSLGLHPNAVLIGAGVRFNDAVPSPEAFNHMITKVMVNGQPVWLDATAEVAPYRALLYAIRDKQALVLPETGAAKIERTPARLPYDSMEKMDAAGTLDKEGTANSHVILLVRGDDELIVRGAFHEISTSQNDEMVQRLFQGMGFSGTTSHADVSRPEDTLEPFRIAYDYKREKPGNDWENLRIIPLLSPIDLPRLDDKEPPVQSVWLGLPRVETSTSSLKLPEGWRAFPPTAIHAKCTYATIDQTYRFEKGTLYAERRVEVLVKKVPVADWKTYKRWEDAASLDREQFVALASSSSKSEWSTTPIKDAEAEEEKHSNDDGGHVNTDASQLVEAARLAILRRDLTEAKSLLDDARHTNVTQIGLWAEYGYLDALNGDLPSAIADYQKELQQHPESYTVYPLLAEVQKRANKNPEAKETLRKWGAARPDDPKPAVMLVTMLLEDADYAGAVTEANAAIARLPEGKKNDEKLQVLLGRSQMNSGDKEAGAATLVKVAQSSSDPQTLDDVAYQLMYASKELAVAETAARAALTQLSEASKSWTLDEDPKEAAEKTRQIVDLWFVLGSALFRDEKPDEAEPYLKAAWHNHICLETGEALGQMELARGKKLAAMQTYQIALEAASKSDAMAVRQPSGAFRLELEHQFDTMLRTIPRSSFEAGRSNPQQLRTIKLGAANGLVGTAEYRVILGGGKVQKLKNIGARSLTGGDERVMSAALREWFPPGSEARLLDNAVLNCHGSVCELVILP